MLSLVYYLFSLIKVGGGISILEEGSYFVGCYFESNKNNSIILNWKGNHGFLGGAISISLFDNPATLSVQSSIFVENTAIETDEELGGGQGGAISIGKSFSG